MLHSNFSPQVFNITGNKIIPKEDILDEIHKIVENKNASKKSSTKLNTLYLSPWKIQKALIKKFDWIKNVTVIRQIPNAFTIIIEEYVPFAIWNSKLVFDVDGNKISDRQFISKAGDNVIQVKSTSPDIFMAFIASIKENSELVSNIKSLEYINNRRWNVKLKSGLVIKLPESDPGHAILKLIKSNKNLINSKDAKIIDIRIKNKTFVTE